MRGRVCLPFLMSVPLSLPSSWSWPMRSRVSSMIWKAVPNSRPYWVRARVSFWGISESVAARPVQAEKRKAVLCCTMWR